MIGHSLDGYLNDLQFGVRVSGGVEAILHAAWYLDDGTIIGDTLVVGEVLKAQRSFDAAVRSSLERIVSASGPGFGDWQWRLSTLPFAFGGAWISISHGGSDLGVGTDYKHHGIAGVCLLSVGCSLILCPKPCSELLQGFAKDIYGDLAVSCTGAIVAVIDAAQRNVVNIWLSMQILDMGSFTFFNPLRGVSDCANGMVDFVPGRAVIDAAHRKRIKYEAKCANIGYDFLPFLFSSLGELEKDAVNLLKRIQKFSVIKVLELVMLVHIFNRIGFAIAKGVGAQLVSPLPTNFL
ncbi:hypothetical protein Tco_0641012 [Tanacetum coccineum]